SAPKGEDLSLRATLFGGHGAREGVDHRAAARSHLVVDPLVGLLHAGLETDGGPPAQQLLDQRIVAVAPAHALGRIELVAALEPDTGDLLDDVDQPVDAHQLVAADVERLDNVARRQLERARGAVVDVHEGAGLLAVAPDLDLVLARQLGGDHLAADRGRRLLAAAVIGAVRAVDVVVARHPRGHAEVLAEVPRHALAEQLLPAVAVLRHRRIGILLLERRHVRPGLLVAVVDAGRRRIEEALGARFAGRHQHVGADQHRQHALGLVGLDEAHAAHVGGEVVDGARPPGGPPAVVQPAKIAHLVLHPGDRLVPLLERLHVDGADPAVAALLQGAHQMSADKTSGAGHQHKIVLGHESLSVSEGFPSLSMAYEVRPRPRRRWAQQSTGSAVVCSPPRRPSSRSVTRSEECRRLIRLVKFPPWSPPPSTAMPAKWMPRPTSPCCGSYARTWTSSGRSMVAAWLPAGPAPCMSTASRYAPVRSP